MAGSVVSHLTEAVNRLMEKTDQLQQARAWDAEQVARLVATFERLTELVAHMEWQQKVESRLAEKLENLVARLDRVLEEQAGAGQLETEGEVTKSFERIIKVVKVVGQVIEIVAGSMEVTFNAVNKAIREHRLAGSPETGKPAETGTPDLTSVLRPLNELVKSLVEGYASSGRTKEPPPPGNGPSAWDEEEALAARP